MWIKSGPTPLSHSATCKSVDLKEASTTINVTILTINICDSDSGVLLYKDYCSIFCVPQTQLELQITRVLAVLANLNLKCLSKRRPTSFQCDTDGIRRGEHVHTNCKEEIKCVPDNHGSISILVDTGFCTHYKILLNNDSYPCKKSNKFPQDKVL